MQEGVSFSFAMPFRFDLTPTEAVDEQRRVAALVRETPLPAPPRLIAGADVSFRGDTAHAAVVVLDLEALETVETATFTGPTVFPYVPGLFSFREIPALLPAFERLAVWPDVVMVDGHGRAHPRRVGLACHLGVVLDVPTFGCAKSILVGRPTDLGEAKGSTAPLVHRKETVGEAVRTRTGVHPVFVSAGHRITLAEAVALTLRTAPHYKIPEPTRRADALSRRPDAS